MSARTANTPIRAKYSVGELHPWSAPGGSSLMHDDMANSDATTYTGPTNSNPNRETTIDQQVEQLGACFGGLVPTMATVTLHGQDYLLGLSFGARTCPLIPFKFQTTMCAWKMETGELVATYSQVPPRQAPNILSLLSNKGKARLFKNATGGAYFCALQRSDGTVDVMIPAVNNRLLFLQYDGGEQFGAPRQLFLDGSTSPSKSPVLKRGDFLVAALPEWTPTDASDTAQGICHWWVSQQGVVGIADPRHPQTRTIDLNTHDLDCPDAANHSNKNDETISNSIAVGPKGVFVVTSQAVYRFVYRDDLKIHCVWRHVYAAPNLRRDFGSTRLTTQGSGTTPTLLGQDFVAFTDGGRKMGLVLLCQGPPTQELSNEKTTTTTQSSNPYLLFGGKAGEGTEESGCENSIVAFSRTSLDGTGSSWRLILANTWGYVTPFSPIRLRSNHVQGLECLQVVNDGDAPPSCQRLWASTRNAGTVVPKLSLTDQLLYFYGLDVEDRKRWGWCHHRRTTWTLIGLHPELVDDEDTPPTKFSFEVGTTQWFRPRKPNEASRKYDNAWGTMVLTNGGVAIGWWKGLRWIREASSSSSTTKSMETPRPAIASVY